MYATNSSGAPAGDTNTWASKHILLYLACNSCPTNCLFFSNSVECLLSNAVYVCSLSEDCKLMREQWLHRVIPAHTDQGWEHKVMQKNLQKGWLMKKNYLLKMSVFSNYFHWNESYTSECF